MNIKEIIYSLYKRIKKTKKRTIELYYMYFTTKGTYTSLLPDKIYLKKLYKEKMGKELNLKNPKTFNEKLNWLKLYDRRPEYTMMVDKYRAREYIKEKIGEEYLVPLIGVYDSVDEIDFEALPNQFVLKCNHDSEVVICKDKGHNDFCCKKGPINSIDEVKAYLRKRLSLNFYKASREWPYKNIKRKIVCEEYLSNEDGTQLVEYNVFCFNGEPKFLKVGTKREDGLLVKSFYDLNWNIMNMSTGSMAGDVFDKPIYLEQMLDIAKILSYDIPHLRVDFLTANRKLYSGELTLFSAGGFWKLQPEKWDYVFGEWCCLSQKNKTR